jgi:hypothetical protein
MLPAIPTYIETLPPPEVIRADIGRLFDAIQAARKLLKVSERLHKDKPAVAGAAAIHQEVQARAS